MFTELISTVLTAFGELIANGIIIFALCFAVGQSIKKVSLFKNISNNNIPFICMVVGAACALLAPTIFLNDPIIIRIFKGIILGWSSTGLYEMIRRKEYDDKDAYGTSGDTDNKQ
ncbi:MAG: hypothetical protein M0P49_00600 [Bacilli bacterium]|nr:hypothetical protein [Bacilli bacterium]